jgi:hypothetical protein
MILDGIVSLLLATTIIYCWRLSKRLGNLHASRTELQKFIDDFNQSIERANASVALLKALSNETDTTLRSQIEKARFLANDLAFLTHKANNIANKLEDHIASSRAVDPNPMGLKSAGKALLQQARALSAEAEAEGLVPPQNWKFPDKQAQARGSLSGQDMAPSKKQAMDAALAQIASRRMPAAPPSAPATARPRQARTPSQGDIRAVKESVDHLRTSLEIKT